MSTTQIEMMPYLSFRGNCEEALNFYKEILDGRIEIVSRYDNPAMNTPEEFKQKVLHARFSFGNYVLFASDVMPKKQDEKMSSNIAISLGLHDDVAARNIFDRLSAQGDI